jgi:hypothetical protein
MHVVTPRGPSPSRGEPGQMTAVMRAMAPASGPRVLRIGLVHAGSVVEERILARRTSVTIGTSERATFAVHAPGMPPEWRFFELVGDDLYLNVRDGMSGRVALETGLRDLADLDGHAKRIGSGYRVRVTDDARGKVVVGDTTLLFQFVAPLPPPSRPQLPLAVKGGLASQIDWSLTIIAAFSFLLHFGVVGAMYSDWMDSIVDTEARASGVVDLMVHIPQAPLEVPTLPDSTLPTASTSATAARKPVAPASAPSKTPSPSEATSLSARAEKMEMQMLLVLGGESALRGVLDRTEIPPADLGHAAESAAGVTASTGTGLHFGRGGGPIRPGSLREGLGTIGPTTSRGAIDAGKERVFAGPVANVSIEPPIGAGLVPNAGAVVAGLKAGFRSCYNAGLSLDPAMAGRVMMSAKIGPNGAVASTSPTGNVGLSEAVVQCLAKRVQNAQFDSPGPTGATLQIPITFVQQTR